MKSILCLFVMMLATVPAFAFTFNYDTKIKADGTIQEFLDFEATVTCKTFKSNRAFTNVKVWTTNPNTPLFNGAVSVGVAYSLKNTRASSMSFSGTAPATGQEVAVTITLEYGLTAQDANMSFSAMTDGRGNIAKSGKVLAGLAECTAIYSSHSFKNVQIELDNVVVFNGPIKGGDAYNVKGSGTQTWKVTANGGDCNKKVMFFIQYEPNGLMGAAEDRKNFSYKVDATTDANGDAQVKDHSFDTENSSLQVYSMCVNMKFGKVTIFLDGKPIIPTEVMEADGHQHFKLNVKLAPGVHNVGVIAEGGDANQNVAFTFTCRE